MTYMLKYDVAPLSILLLTYMELLTSNIFYVEISAFYLLIVE